MKKLVLILFLLSVLKLNAQNYDLIVTTQGDSIACFIDSVTNTNIYFRMKMQNIWVQTNSVLNKISNYEKGVIDKKLVIFKTGSSFIKRVKTPADLIKTKSLYQGRYIFAPSAFGINKGTFSYSNYSLILNEIQFGIDDNFSLGIGNNILYFPFYLMPTITYQINEKSAFAIGDLLLLTPVPDMIFMGNLLYGLYTRGSLDNNFTIGVGLWTTSFEAQTVSPAYNISAQLKISENAYFLTENFWFQMNFETGASYPNQIDDPSCEGCYWIEYVEEEFIRKETIMFGLSGIRFIGNNNPKNSYQLGLIYIILKHGSVPYQYTQPPWEIEYTENQIEFIAFPLLSYSRKL